MFDSGNSILNLQAAAAAVASQSHEPPSLMGSFLSAVLDRPQSRQKIGSVSENALSYIGSLNPIQQATFRKWEFASPVLPSRENLARQQVGFVPRKPAYPWPQVPQPTFKIGYLRHLSPTPVALPRTNPPYATFYIRPTIKFKKQPLASPGPNSAAEYRGIRRGSLLQWVRFVVFHSYPHPFAFHPRPAQLFPAPPDVPESIHRPESHPIQQPSFKKEAFASSRPVTRRTPNGLVPQKTTFPGQPRARNRPFASSQLSLRSLFRFIGGHRRPAKPFPPHTTHPSPIQSSFHRPISKIGCLRHQPASRYFRARLPHFSAPPTRVIFLFMQGGPSSIHSFDPKERLTPDDRKPLTDVAGVVANKIFS